MKKLLDLKSLITLSLILTLEFITIYVFLIRDMDLIQLVFVLFTNVVTGVVTYFFTKKSDKEK